MEPSSSTSSSDGSLRGALGWLVGLALLWGADALLAPGIARWAGTEFRDQILALGQGRILDPVVFVKNRGTDAVILVTALVVVAQVAWQARHVVRRRVGPAWAWLPLSAAWFVALNIFLKVAGHTGLWWLLLYSAHPNLQLAAFHIEQILLEEARAPIRIVVLGSSQGQSQIATGELNRYGASEVRAANLSYAGADAADFVLIREHYQRINPQVLVIYLSPINIYGGVSGTRWTPLLTPTSLAYLMPSGVLALAERPRILEGVVGLGLPTVAQRPALQHALFGRISEQGYQRPVDRARRTGLEKPTRTGSTQEANKYSADERPATFEKQMLEAFLLEEATRGRQVVVIDGMVHPALMAAFPAEVRTGYDALMVRLSGLHENVIVLHDELPRHTADDYTDLYHVREDVRTAFTRALAHALAGRLGLRMTVVGATGSAGMAEQLSIRVPIARAPAPVTDANQR